MRVRAVRLMRALSRSFGVIDRMIVPWPRGFSFDGDRAAVEYSVLVPQLTAYGSSTAYLVRAEPGRREAFEPANADVVGAQRRRHQRVVVHRAVHVRPRR